MCSVSAIFDYGRERVPVEQWTPQGLEAFEEMVEKARQFDEIQNQPDCEDPAKAEWLEEVRDRLKRIEGKLSEREKE